MNLLAIFRWLRPALGGGGGGGGDGGAAQAAAEESRKEGLRKQVMAMYGKGGSVPVYGPAAMTNFGSMFEGTPGMEGLFSSMGYGGEPQIVGYSSDPTSDAAAKQIAEAKDALAKATGGYYTSELGKTAKEAEEQNVNRLARQGLTGGSEQARSAGKISEDTAIGGTRVSDAVRSAIAGLEGSLANEEAGALAMVNQGAGDAAVQSAASRIRNAIDTSASQEKGDIFAGLFNDFAGSALSGNAMDNTGLLQDRYQKMKNNSYFAAKPGKAAITSTG